VTQVVAGVFSGLLMASATVAIGPIMLFYLAKDPSPFFRALLLRIPPVYMTMGLVVLAYPTWIAVGAVAGLLYGISDVEAPRGGIGSSNLLFTLAILVVAIMMAPPLAILLRKVVLGVAAMTVLFVGIFGWLLPFMAR
jgi:hypothetical protein